MTFSINPTANKTQAMFQQMAIAQNGTGATAVIAGGAGTASTVSVAPPVAATSAASNSGTMVSGTGTTETGGSCSCSCLCGVAAFPDAAVQGIGAFGGLSGEFYASKSPFPILTYIGAMPMSALEA